MGLRRRIRLKEREIEQAHRALRESTAEFRRTLHRRLSSRAAMAVGFAGGLLLGWQRRRRAKGTPRRRAADAGRPMRKRVSAGMPPHWMRSYIVWPFLLATARDLVVNRRPTRGES